MTVGIPEIWSCQKHSFCLFVWNTVDTELVWQERLPSSASGVRIDLTDQLHWFLSPAHGCISITWLHIRPNSRNLPGRRLSEKLCVPTWSTRRQALCTETNSFYSVPWHEEKQKLCFWHFASYLRNKLSYSHVEGIIMIRYPYWTPWFIWLLAQVTPTWHIMVTGWAYYCLESKVLGWPHISRSDNSALKLSPRALICGQRSGLNQLYFGGHFAEKWYFSDATYVIYPYFVTS